MVPGLRSVLFRFDMLLISENTPCSKVSIGSKKSHLLKQDVSQVDVRSLIAEATSMLISSEYTLLGTHGSLTLAP